MGCYRHFDALDTCAPCAEAEAESMREERDALREENARLKSEVVSAQNAVVGFKQERDNANAEVATLKDILETYKRVKNGDLNALREELERMDHLAHRWQEQFELAEADAETLRARLARMSAVVSAAKSLMAGPHKDWDDTVSRFTELADTLAAYDAAEGEK